MPAGASSLGQQRREAQHPPVDSDVVNLNAAFDQELLDVAVGQAEAQVPADREHNYIGWGSGSRRRPSAQGSTGGTGEWFSWLECQRPDHLTANATEPTEV